MADAKATFQIELEDGTSGPAKNAADALKNLQEQMQADTKELAAMQKAMKNLQGGTVVNVEQFRQLKTAIDAKKQAIAEATAAYGKLGGNFANLTSKGRGPSSMFQQLQQQAQALPGPLGRVSQGLSSIKTMLGGGAMALGIAAVAAAMLAVAAAAAVATVALFKYGVAQANARRNEHLQLEALTKMRSMWGFAAGNAKEMQGAIDQVSASTPLTREKIAGLTQELYKMGLRGENLTLALEGTAIKTAALGEEAGKNFAHWAAGAHLAGQSVKRLTDDVKARFGGVVAAQMLDLDVQARKMHESFAALFDDLNLEGLLKALNTLTSLFSQSTRSGQALKAILTAVFQPMIGAIERLAPLAKRFFQGMVIGALLVGIAFLKVRNALRDAFDMKAVKQLDLMKVALYAGVAALFVFGLAVTGAMVLFVGLLIWAAPFIWAAVTALGALAVQGLILAAPFILGALAIGLFIATLYQLYKLWEEIDFAALGKYMMQGIVNGIMGAKEWVISAVSDVGSSAKEALMSLLGIASPSKEFMKLGRAVPQGFARGVEEGSGEVDATVRDMAPEQAAGAGGVGGGRPVTVNIGDIYVQTATDDPKAHAGGILRELQRALEGVSIQLGAVPG